jgi:Uma2 family endonuclease
MKTALVKIGPADHGQPFSEEEFRYVEFEAGYKYELIDGKLYVSYEADLPANVVDDWLYLQVKLYSREHPEVINYVTCKPRVFAPGRRRVTIPEPDLAAYHDFPHHLLLQDLRWQDVSPLLVGEVVSKSDPDKDFVRNVRLYLQVPTIREYWILDPRNDPTKPTLYVYRRRGSRWQRPIEVAPGGLYTTKLLPGFELILDCQR